MISRKLVKSLIWLVKIVDVGLVWPNHYKSKCLIFSKPFAWCLNSLFLSQQTKFSSHVLKTLGTQQVVSWASLLIISLTSSRVSIMSNPTMSKRWKKKRMGRENNSNKINSRVIFQGAINFYNQLGHLKNDCPLNKEAKKYKMKKRILVETWSKLLFLLI